MADFARLVRAQLYAKTDLPAGVRRGERCGSLCCTSQEAVSIKDLHSMRHVFSYRAKRAGIPESIIAKFVGHKVLAMTHHYADHDTDEELRAEIRKLPPLFIGEFDTGETAARQRLAQLAYSLPIETVENLLGIARLHGYLPVPLSRSDTRCYAIKKSDGEFTRATSYLILIGLFNKTQYII